MKNKTITHATRPFGDSFGGRRYAQLKRAATALALLTVAVCASAQEASPPTGPPAASTEWQRMMEGLRKAKPIPQPKDGMRSETLTPSGELVRSNLLTGRISVLAASKVEANSTAANRVAGNAGMDPTAANGETRAMIGDGPEAFNVTGASPRVITPTPPRPLLLPHIFQPYRTHFKLLLRFFVRGFGDQYYVCSAVSVSSFHLLSAGHCVYSHDPLGDGSGRGAGFAAEVWAWPSQTDFTDPLDASQWPDFPWGVVKSTVQTAYTGWMNNMDFNWDIAFITVDRRIGDHIGWMGREWGVTGKTLFYSGYPTERPYVAANNPFQYPGADDNNVLLYTCCRIRLSAYTYGGHSGGGVFRFDGTNGANYMIQGVNSTSDRAGEAESTLFRAQHNADLVNIIARDRAEDPPLDRAQLIEYSMDDNSKRLHDTVVAVGHPFSFQINAFNAGYISAGTTTADVYLTQSRTAITSGIYIGSNVLGELAANQYVIWNTSLVVPTTVPPGNYYLGWRLRGTNPQYSTDRDVAIITKNVLRVVGMAAVQVNPNTVAGGISTTGTVYLTSPAPANGIAHGIDVLLSSNNPAARVNGFVFVPEGAMSAPFTVTTTGVAKATTATITANLKGVLKTTALTIKPVLSNTLALAHTAVVGGNGSTGTVTLSAPAPAGGLMVKLSSSSPKAVVPATVRIDAGSTTATFAITTSIVTRPTPAVIKAIIGGVTKTATLSVNPVQPKTIALQPSIVKGGTQSTATVTINGLAPAGGATISLTSSNAKAKVPSTVRVNAGSTSVTFAVNTSAVTTRITASIKATSAGVSKAADLTIQP